MKLTLLNVVQSYLNKTGDFYVDDIYQLDVSQQVAQIAEEVYYSLIQKFPKWQHTTVVGQLGAVSDTERPNYMTIPDSVGSVEDCTISYNHVTDRVSNNYRTVAYLQPEDFLKRMQARQSTLPNTQEVEDYNGTKYVVLNNRYPQLCTSFDGKYLIFDSYHSDYDDTLQSSKSRVVYNKEAVFLQENDFVIPLPESMSGLYLDLVCIECYENLLQQPAPPSMARRAAIKMVTAQQDVRKTGSLNKQKQKFGRR